MQNRRRWFAVDLAIFLGALGVLLNRVPTIAHFLENADHGYQLAAGAELLRGHFPGVQSVSNYGPLIAVLTAATLWATGNLVAEAALCAFAWATAIWLAYHLVRRSFGVPAGLAAAVAAFLCVARFHKWYVWVIPMAALATVGAESTTDARWRWVAGGLVCGIGSLMRPEFGVATLIVLAAIALSDGLGGRGLHWSRAWTMLAIGFVVPPFLWGATLLIVAGPTGVMSALAVVPESVAGSVAYWSKPPPPFRLDQPLSLMSSHALLLWLLPAVEVVAIVIGGWFAYGERRGRLADEGRALAAIGLMGLACYPHTIYRAGIHHLWQGIWPLLLCVPALCALAVASTRASSGYAPTSFARAFMAAAFLLAAGTVVVISPHLRHPHFDLAPYGRPPLAGLAELREGLDAASDHPNARLATTIDRLTKPDETILILSYSPQLLYFSARAPMGRCLVYQRGLFESAAWRREHLARLEESPPALVVAPVGFQQLAPDQGFRAGQPEMYDYVLAHYPRRVEIRGNLELRAPASTASAPP